MLPLTKSFLTPRENFRRTALYSTRGRSGNPARVAEAEIAEKIRMLNPPASSLGYHLRTCALDDGKQFLLFLVRNLQFVQRSLQVAHGGIEFRIADMHVSVR